MQCKGNTLISENRLKYKCLIFNVSAYDYDYHNSLYVSTQQLYILHMIVVKWSILKIIYCQHNIRRIPAYHVCCVGMSVTKLAPSFDL